MDLETFCRLREIVYENSGIYLNETKHSMVSSRLAKRMRLLGLSEAEQYLQYLIRDKTGSEIVHLLDVISTNVTSYYREKDHFEFLGESISELIKKGQHRIRIWCAAASTGEEAYSIAMTSVLASQESVADVKILATDISTRALLKAQKGTYEADLMDTVPQYLRKRFYERHCEGTQSFYTAKAPLKKMISFRRLNLSKTPFPMKGPLDIVFCRNVMIYFSQQVRSALIDEIHRLLRLEGFLITGHAESLTGLNSPFKCIRPSIYQKTA